MIVTKLIAASVAGAAFGAGALALTPSQAASTPSTSDSSAVADANHHAGLARHRNVLHATWTTRDKVHHEAVRGVVRLVSSSSITVRAADGFVETYRVYPSTKVRVLRDGHKGLDSIRDVKKGDLALVVGTGAHHATHVIARAPKSTTSTS